MRPAAWRLEHDQQRQDGQRRDQQQFLIIDVGDDLGLLIDGGIERRAVRRGHMHYDRSGSRR